MNEISNAPGYSVDPTCGGNSSEQVIDADRALPVAEAALAFCKMARTPDRMPVYIKQVKQAALMDGLTRLLADIYGDRSQTPLTFADLLHRLGASSLVVSVLSRTQGQPVANKLLARLAHRLTLTPEGQKQFQIVAALYGLAGEQARPPAEIALITGLPLKEIRHLIIMMRCRLESDLVKRFVEETTSKLLREFAKSDLYREVLACEAGGRVHPVVNPIDQVEAIKDLETLADSLAENIDASPTVNICGQAGTGKSSLALKLAQCLAQKGKRVLYVTHSRFFAQHVQNLTRFYPGDLTVSTFHALCHQYARQAGIVIPSYRNNKVFNELFPELLIEAIHIRRENVFDAIIVDEGHAFLPNFWRSLKFCLRDLQRSAFFYFYDPLVLALAKNKAAPFASRNITLTKAMRPNFNLAAMEGGLEIYEAISKEESQLAISKVVLGLLNQGIRPDEIAIVAADSLPRVCDSRCHLPRGIRLSATPGGRRKHILYTSLASFRSMSKRVVIVNLEKEVEDIAEWKLKYLSYAAFSRAEEKLVLIGNLKAIHKVLPDGVKIVNPEAYEPHLRRL